ncbi:MAG: universal stress protein [Coleofasciculus sp. G1-WW12-02]|uniref:universal stress protein n=1 Tax=Coleofasciculus sp. G1-WW12-02 TaxID=3068483 RepID=UPI003304EC42
MTYKRILVALDHSSQTEGVFSQSLDIAKQDNAALMIFHCLPIENQGVGFYGDMFGRELIDFSRRMQDKLKKESDETQKWLADYCKKATDQGVATEWTCKMGDAGSAIRDLVNSWDADLVVIGRRGRRGLTEVLLGSVSNHVLHHVPCSVLVVQGVATGASEK